MTMALNSQTAIALCFDYPCKNIFYLLPTFTNFHCYEALYNQLNNANIGNCGSVDMHALWAAWPEVDQRQLRCLFNGNEFLGRQILF